MKKLTFILFLFLTGSIYAQSIEYFYDAAGNRTQRKLVVLNPSETGRYMQPKDSVAAQLTSDSKLTVYPNPVKEQLTLKVDGVFNAYQITLTDLSGRVLLSNTINEKVKKLDFTNYPKGTYLLRTGVNDQFTEWKIIKQ